jgi:hypothetical protein
VRSVRRVALNSSGRWLPPNLQTPRLAACEVSAVGESKLCDDATVLVTIDLVNGNNLTVKEFTREVAC